LRLKPWKP